MKTHSRAHVCAALLVGRHYSHSKGKTAVTTQTNVNYPGILKQNPAEVGDWLWCPTFAQLFILEVISSRIHFLRRAAYTTLRQVFPVTSLRQHKYILCHHHPHSPLSIQAGQPSIYKIHNLKAGDLRPINMARRSISSSNVPFTPSRSEASNVFWFWSKVMIRITSFSTYILVKHKKVNNKMPDKMSELQYFPTFPGNES